MHYEKKKKLGSRLNCIFSVSYKAYNNFLYFVNVYDSNKTLNFL